MSVDAAHMTGFCFLTLLLVLLIYRWLTRVQMEKRRRLYATRRDDFDGLLARYNPYYRSLSNIGRERFLHRVLLFMEAKKFEYIDIEPEESMPLLVSAAAVQLTFGLGHFRMDYFRTIHILKDKYRYGLYNMPFEGHVSEDGIYLSWTHFIREYTDYSDGQNVGLHEMAHALTYVNFAVQDGRDNSFHDHFTEFSAVARPIFERMQAGESTLLDPYAATNYQEFWAVCIETFFERSTTFRRQLPELYFSLCSLLNQDPLTPNKILNFNAMSPGDINDGLARTGS
ncbi:MAG TPA: zinc-dependent peptidase [Puia sp.]|nr:zinc-dependent peptidase [Puia sp.]